MSTYVQDKLKIKDVADRTGVAAATIRMWEQRYGFPSPSRTPSGYRMYSEADIEAIRTVTALRGRGLSIVEAVERARQAPHGVAEQHPSIYAAVASVDPSAHPRVLRRSTLAAISHAIEDELLARSVSGIVIGAFQRERFYDRVAHRYEQIALRSELTIVFADFERFDGPARRPAQVPLAPNDALGNEWAVVIDAPGYAACLLAWERPNRAAGEERMFEAVISLDPRAVRRAITVAAALARRADEGLAHTLDGLLESRPLALEPAASALTSLTSRMVAYMDERAAEDHR